MDSVKVTLHGLPAYRELIRRAKRDKVFKGCGNADNLWVLLKFKTPELALEWLEKE